MTPNLYSPRRIRLLTGRVTCPQCDKPCFRSHLQAGRSFQTCEHKRCDTEWWLLALPPDCFAGWLAAILGEREAQRLVTHCWPNLASTPLPQLWYQQLAEDEPTWIQIAVRPRERHLYRHANAKDLLTVLLAA